MDASLVAVPAVVAITSREVDRQAILIQTIWVLFLMHFREDTLRRAPTTNLWMSVQLKKSNLTISSNTTKKK